MDALVETEPKEFVGGEVRLKIILTHQLNSDPLQVGNVAWRYAVARCNSLSERHHNPTWQISTAEEISQKFSKAVVSVHLVFGVTVQFETTAI
jgi:hypothetical protein